MKCIVYFEFCPEDIDKVIAKNIESQQIREKEPERFGTVLFPHHYTGHCKGFLITDTTQEQMNNASVFWFPELRLKYVPIGDISDWMAAYMKPKQ